MLRRYQSRRPWAVTFLSMSSFRLKAKRPQKKKSLSVPLFFLLPGFEYTKSSAAARSSTVFVSHVVHTTSRNGKSHGNTQCLMCADGRSIYTVVIAAGRASTEAKRRGSPATRRWALVELLDRPSRGARES